MALPERLVQGGALCLEGCVLRPKGTAFRPVLVLRSGDQVWRVPGLWKDTAQGTFSVFLPMELTRELPLGLVHYELYLVDPSGQEFVVSQGSFEVEPRLSPEG